MLRRRNEGKNVFSVEKKLLLLKVKTAFFDKTRWKNDFLLIMNVKTAKQRFHSFSQIILCKSPNVVKVKKPKRLLQLFTLGWTLKL